MNDWKHNFVRLWFRKNQGFTLIEALVAILVITTFTLTALQAMAIAAIFRVKAEQKSGATNWIQEQVEQAKFLGFSMNRNGDDSDTSTLPDTNPDNTLCTATSSSNGYGNSLRNFILGNPFNNKSSYTIKNPDGTDYFTGSTMEHATDGYNVNTKDPDPDNDGENELPDIPGKTIWLLRNMNPKDEEPYQVLELEYVAVLDDGSGNPSTKKSDIVSELYTEVIPDEAFACD